MTEEQEQRRPVIDWSRLKGVHMSARVILLVLAALVALFGVFAGPVFNADPNLQLLTLLSLFFGWLGLVVGRD